MKSYFLSCAGLLFGLLAASGCSKEVKAEFPRPPATAGIPASETSESPPEPTDELVVDLEPAPAAEPEPEPETDEPLPTPAAPRPAPVSAEPVEEPSPARPSTHLAATDNTPANPEVSTKLQRAGTLLSSLGGRGLSDGQRDQVAAARGFVAQAQRALDEGDERRALVLVDKGLILAEDVERTSR
jgi:hypothetical protein